jgi:hypothetical protein
LGGVAPARRGEIELRAEPALGWGIPQVAFEVGEAWCRESRKQRQLVRGEEVPVLLLPRRGEPLIARKPQLHQWKECALGDQESHHLTIVRNLTVAREEKSSKRKWPQRNFTHDHAPAATEEERVNLIKGGAIGAETEWR